METEYETYQLANRNDSIYKIDYLCGIFIYIKDDLDEIIENVLESGVYVEFADQATLKDTTILFKKKIIYRDKLKYENE